MNWRCSVSSDHCCPVAIPQVCNCTALPLTDVLVFTSTHLPMDKCVPASIQKVLPEGAPSNGELYPAQAVSPAS